MQYNEMLGTGYAHRLLLIDILRGDLGQPVAISRDDLLAYRAGMQFAEIDSRSNRLVEASEPVHTPRTGKQLCECWEYKYIGDTDHEFKPYTGIRQWVRVGPGYPHCRHEFDFGTDIARVNATRTVKFNPANTVPYLDKVRRADLGAFIARMRGYGWGYWHGTYNKSPDNNRWYQEYRKQVDWMKEVFMLDFNNGFTHGMEYMRSLLNNNTGEGEYRG